MYLLAVAIKRERTNVGTPETSAISFDARPGITYSISSVQCVVSGIAQLFTSSRSKQTMLDGDLKTVKGS